MNVLINVDVPDLASAIAFYTRAFGLYETRRFGEDGAELGGWPVPLFLLRKAAGTIGAGESRRIYDRHWTPIHFDVVVEDINAALERALDAGALLEQEIRTNVWGKIAVLADPFGHGFCLIQLINRGYDEVATPS